MASLSADFLAGVIEGFYGQPWSALERTELFNWMAAWGLNTYLYAPKDDLKHRSLWREVYTEAEAESMGELVRACSERRIRFIHALGPGLDIRYSSTADLDHLKARFSQMLSLGCRHFALLFDDIPDRMDARDAERWGSFASAQCHVANSLFSWIRERGPDSRFLFCPTPYCGRMAQRSLGGRGYLETVGRELAAPIDIFWTGPEIVSREISVAQVAELESMFRRRPVIWDNLHANDYDGRRFYCGPYAGRSPELRAHVSGLLSNPNNEFPLNYVPLRTLARFVHSDGVWDPRREYLEAIRDWFLRFKAAGAPLSFEDLVLFGDCHYLPYEQGPGAENLLALARSLLARNPSEWGQSAVVFLREAARLREFCGRLADLMDRPLFHAMSRRVWELREELDLLEKYVAFHGSGVEPEATFRSDFHLPGTYRGGMVAGLQRLLVQHADGTFSPMPTQSGAPSTLAP